MYLISAVLRVSLRDGEQMVDGIKGGWRIVIVATILLFIGLSASVLYLLILAVKFLLCQYYAATHQEETAPGAVTILQPILSGDPHLEEMLLKNLAIADESTKFIWLIDSEDAEAQQIVARLSKDSRQHLQALQCPTAAGDENPKSAKLQIGLEKVATEYVAVLDDDTMIAKDNLGKAIHALQTHDLYTGLPCYLPGTNIWASLVAHFVNNNSIMTYLPLLLFSSPTTINGMFYVMRAQKLNDLGGFRAIKSQLCDDYAIAKLLKSHGAKIHQGIAPQYLQTTVDTRDDYIRLMQRWFVFANVLVRDQSRGMIAGLFVLHGLPPFLLWLSLLSIFGSFVGFLIPLAVLIIRHFAIRTLQRAVFGTPPVFLAWVSVLAELLQPLHWLHACFHNVVRWRSRLIRVDRNGGFSYVEGDQQ